MIKINVVLNNNHWNKYLKNPINFIDKKISQINKKNKLYKKNVLICSLLLTGTSEIKKLNKKFRKKNRSTDVLSFPFYEPKSLKKIIVKEKEIYIGDIIVNLNKITNKNNKIKFNQQFNKLWVHGFVHLFGYKHKKDKDYNIMEKVEKKYLECIK
tara:strand:- start:174 stop:638 length:465 start_codon:yes stop_codon:yes gene_type:complete